MTAYNATNSVPLEVLPTLSGVVQKFRAAATNDGQSTYTPDGLAAAPIFGLGAAQLQGNEIVEGGIVTLVSFIGSLLNSGALCWVLIDCASGAQQVGTGTGSNQASTVGQVQTGTLITAEGGGTANALTATIASTLTQLADGEPFTIIASAANTASATLLVTLGATALAVLPIVKGNNQPLSLGDIPAAGYPALLNYSAKFDAYVMQNPATGISQPVGVVSTTRDIKAVQATAGTSLTYTAGQLVVSTALNGVAYLLANFNETFNGTETGLGGMDTGSLPVSGFVAFYGALTDRGAQGIFGTSAASLVGEVYGGSNLPAGVIATALIGVWPTDENGNLPIAAQRGRRLSVQAQFVLKTTVVTGENEFESFSLAAAVPVNAVTVTGTMEVINLETSGGGASLDLVSTATGLGDQVCGGPLPTAGEGLLSNYELDFVTPQTLFFNTTNLTGTTNYYATVVSYSI